jgi:molybdopterin-guanine dinucleotide biosynthesis protein B
VKAVAVVGFKGSGKTALATKLVRILSSRGYRVAALKHAHVGLTLCPTDSAKLFEAGAVVALAVSQEAVETLERRSLTLSEALSLLRSYDFLVAEGFKESFPGVRVAVVRSGEELEKLMHPLTIAAYAPSGGVASTSVPTYGSGEEEKLADLIEEKAFEPPAGLNCGSCRYGNCIALAAAVLKGEATVRDCAVLGSKVRVFVNGKPIELNPFVQNLFKKVITAIVSTLKGVPEKAQRVSIEIEE